MEKYQNLCGQLQALVDEIKLTVGTSWENPQEDKIVASKVGQASPTWASLIMFMKKKQISSIQQLFALDDKEKVLQEALFNPDQIQKRAGKSAFNKKGDR